MKANENEANRLTEDQLELYQLNLCEEKHINSKTT